MTDNTRDEVEEFVTVLSLLDIPDNLKRAIGVFVINAGYKRKPSNEDGLVRLDLSKLKKYSGIYGLPPKEYTLVNVEDLENVGTPKQEKVISLENLPEILDEVIPELYFKSGESLNGRIITEAICKKISKNS